MSFVGPKRWLPVGIMLLILSLVAGCAPAGSPAASGTGQTGGAEQAPETRVVQHLAGESTIPARPTRVAYTSTAVQFYPLGIKPVAAWVSDVQKQWAPAEWFDGIADVGNPLNLEVIAAAQPDLIIGWETNLEQYEQLSQIAPTVIVEFDHSGRWKEYSAELAELVGATEQFEQFMADYEDRIEDIRSRMPVPPEEIEVSVVRLYEDRVNLYTRGGFLGVILDDFGFKRPSSQDLGVEESRAQVDNPIQYTVTFEELQKADGDVLIIVMTQRDDPKAQEQVNKLRDTVTSHPLWSKLEAVEAGNVAEVGFAWIGSIGTVHIVLDDIERIFIDEQLGA